MELFFNEISLHSHVSSDQRVEYQHLVTVCQGLISNGINSCRIDSSDLFELSVRYNGIDTQKNISNFIFSYFHNPFSTERLVEKEDVYYAHDWKFQTTDCVGLAYAAITDSAVVSLYVSGFDRSLVSVFRDEEELPVRNFSTSEHLEYHREWLFVLNDSELLTSKVSPDKKPIHITHDHGEDVLLEFAHRLCQCEYVEAVDSAPYSPGCHRFIKSKKADGTIELVLLHTGQKLTLRVKTTARNMPETERIADLLGKRYGNGR